MTSVKGIEWANGRRTPIADAVHELDYAPPMGGPVRAPPSGVGGGPSLPSPPPSPGVSPFVRLVFPPRIEKLPGSADFVTESYELALPAGVNSTVVLPAFSLPSSQVGWIQEFRLYILSQLNTTRIQWDLRINEGPVSGFTRINPPGVANLVLIITNELRVRAPDGAKIDVLITNLDGAAATVGAHVSGWYHSRAEEIRTFGDSAV